MHWKFLSFKSTAGNICNFFNKWLKAEFCSDAWTYELSFYEFSPMALCLLRVVLNDDILRQVRIFPMLRNPKHQLLDVKVNDL